MNINWIHSIIAQLVDRSTISPTRAAYCNDLRVPSGEVSITWVIDPGEFAFVRTAIIRSRFKTRRPAMPFDGLLIGFSTVGDNAPARDGRYLRRLFYLNWLDLDPESIYQTRKHFLPFEGVRPLSVRPGIWGQL